MRTLFFFICLFVATQSFASETDSYNFIFFYKEKNKQTEKMETIFQQTMQQAKGKASGKIV